MQEFENSLNKQRRCWMPRTAARDQALIQARQLTRLSAHTIRAIHRDDTAPGGGVADGSTHVDVEHPARPGILPGSVLCRLHPGCHQGIR